MNSLSAYLNPFANGGAVPTNVPDSAATSTTALDISNTLKNSATKSDDWKASLRLKLQATLHERREKAPLFEELFDRYVKSRPADGRKHLSRVIGKCMALGEVEVLKEILAHEPMESMYLEGPVDPRGWETLIAAMPAGFPVRAVRLAMMRLCSSEQVDLLLKALRGMPKMEKLSLHMVGVDGTFPSERSDEPAFEALKAVIVLTSSDPELNVCPLLLEIFRLRQLRSLSIQDYGAITPEQHDSLAVALRGQTLLDSLKLIIEKPCSTPKQLDCYMPFLCGQAFAALDLDGWELETSNFNLLLAALRAKPALTSLSLCNFTFLKGTESEPVQISALAGMRNLLDLDLGWNAFEDDTMTQLLNALKKEQTCLMFLGLNGNSIGSTTIAAIADLLNANRTLRELSLQRTVLPDRASWSAHALEALTKAFEANTSLQRFRVRRPDIPAAYHARQVDFLKRNRDFFAANGMWAALSSVRPGFPKDLAGHIFKQGLTRSDAVSMSSVNWAAWDARGRDDGPSK